MSTAFRNVYEDQERARAYATLDFPGTYYLAFRDIPQLLQQHVAGRSALDFGCGAGRSTRFLRDLGFAVIGVDISEEMLRLAQSRDPDLTYLLLPPDDFTPLGERSFDLILCAFPFDNVPLVERRIHLFRELAQRLEPDGCIVNLVSAPEIYQHEWLSFSTKDFPDNRTAASGDVVHITMLDVADRRPVEDVFWTHEENLRQFESAGLTVREVHRPLGNDDDPYEWVSERSVSPWAIYVLSR